MRAIKRFRLLALSFLALGTFVAVPLIPNRATALSGSEFRAGRIMDDGIFFNSGSMSEGQIQEFLNAKVPVCDTNGEKLIYDSRYGDTVTRKVYAERRGVSTPFVCLKDYRQDTGNKSPEEMLCNGHVAGNKSAARIIKEVADSCGVSPKVLIVLLQKEQSLVTDDWPWPRQYRSATGYGCPDTAPCDAQYYGFFNQVYNAARIYKYYAKYPNSFNHIAGRNNNVLYHPNTGCGRSSVFIANQATAGLYNYTPYQPNAAALSNLYGTGDSCSAYGNRNFWRMFNDWFGGTTTDFKWSTTGYKILDKTESYYVDPGKLMPGEVYLAKLHAYNTGTATWYRDGPTPMVLGTTHPTPGASQFCLSSWIACNRPARLVEQSVAPGQLGHFMFLFRAPYASGSYRESFKPLAEMLAWTNDAEGQSFGIIVTNPGTYRWSSTGYKILTADESQYVDPGKLKPNTTYLAKLHAYNTGTATWHKTGPTPVVLGTSSPTGRPSILCNPATWIACTRPASMVESSVAPGQLGHFMFLFRTPSTYGEHREHFKPVAEMHSWLNDIPENSFGIWVVP
jgi:hypothetical protein